MVPPLPQTLTPHPSGLTLTPEQHEIVTLDRSHCVVNAVAGSGKTTTLALRILHLLDHGMAPERMLILMYNRSARDDFERKLRQLMGDRPQRLPEIRTFHAMGYRLYQRLIRDGVLPPVDERVLSDAEIQMQLLNLMRERMPSGLQNEWRRQKQELVATAMSYIERVKSGLLPPAEVFDLLGLNPRHRYLIDVFDAFEDWRKQHRRLSYADMLYEPVKCIHQSTALQQLVGNKMDLVLVDEYQDANDIQHLLLRYVAGERAKVTVVGDPDQTIYEFRGAQPELLLSRFADEFAAPVPLNLSTSFRYGPAVAALANRLIAANSRRKAVTCHAHANNPDTAVDARAVRSEPDALLALIKHHRDQGRALADIAVLCRVWSQSVGFELRLLAAHLPYRIASGKGALFHRDILSLTDVLKIANGALSYAEAKERGELFLSVLRYPHSSLNDSAVRQLANALTTAGRHWPAVLKEAINHAPHGLAKARLSKLARALQGVVTLPKAAGALKHYARETELAESLRSSAMTRDAGEERVGTADAFIDYLDGLGLRTPDALNHLDELRGQRTAAQDDALLLTTIHRAKGLEWPVVIVPGLTEGTLPNTFRDETLSASQLESERRLLYVAMTRAIHQLHLWWPIATTTDSPKPSRFLRELGLLNPRSSVTATDTLPA